MSDHDSPISLHGEIINALNLTLWLSYDFHYSLAYSVVLFTAHWLYWRVIGVNYSRSFGQKMFGIAVICNDGSQLTGEMWDKRSFLKLKFLIPLVNIYLGVYEFARISQRHTHQSNLDLKIVGFPSHVIVKYKEEMILDPFNRGRLLELEDLQEILYQNYGDSVEFEAGYLNQISDEKIIIRMLRNLKNSYMDSFAYDMAIICNKMILGIIPYSIDEIRDMGILEEKLGNYENAIKFLNTYLEKDPNAEDVDYVLELIKEIRNKTNQ